MEGMVNNILLAFVIIVPNEGINVIRLFLSYSFTVKRSFIPFSCTELFVFTDQGNKRITFISVFNIWANSTSQIFPFDSPFIIDF